MLNVSTFGNTADIYAIVHLVPHACQHMTVDQSHSSGVTFAKIWRLAGSGGTKTVSFTNPQKKSRTGLSSLFFANFKMFHGLMNNPVYCRDLPYQN